MMKLLIINWWFIDATQRPSFLSQCNWKKLPDFINVTGIAAHACWWLNNEKPKWQSVPPSRALGACGEPGDGFKSHFNELIKVGNPETVSTGRRCTPRRPNIYKQTRVLTDTELHDVRVIRPADNQVYEQDRYPVQSPRTAPQRVRGRHL